MNYLAAVFCNGNVSTGRHHGEAFANLSEVDKESDLISGHLNPDGTFTTEMDYINKEVILVRHAESMWNAKSSNNLDSGLTSKGVSQAQGVARFIKKNIDCRGLVGFTSPFERCVMTSLPIRQQTGIRFFIDSHITELTNHFPVEGVTVPCRRNKYFDIEWNNYCTTTFHEESSDGFIGRLYAFIESLPDRSLVITHGSVVQTLIEIVLGVKVKEVPVWDNSIGNASVTHIKNGTVIYMASRG